MCDHDPRYLAPGIDGEYCTLCALDTVFEALDRHSLALVSAKNVLREMVKLRAVKSSQPGYCVVIAPEGYLYEARQALSEAESVTQDRGSYSDRIAFALYALRQLADETNYEIENRSHEWDMCDHHIVWDGTSATPWEWAGHAINIIEGSAPWRRDEQGN